ncbi:MAG: hydrogenase maturation protease [Desulfurococcus sp.]|nr:hydrogenase maturation protease [Desulfurococcus sp.]
MHLNEFFHQNVDLASILRRLLEGSTLIIGLGSPLRMDDQAGLLLCDELTSRGVECVKCEYGLENCLSEMKGARRIIIVDAVLYEDAKPGEIVIVGEDALLEKYSLATTHSIPLKTLLKLMHESGIEEIYIIGIVPQSLDYGLEVSEVVRESVRRLVAAFIEAIKTQGDHI